MLRALSVLLALAATATAQYLSKPFAIRMIGTTNKSIDGYVTSNFEHPNCIGSFPGRYLCYEADRGGSWWPFQYYLNSTSADQVESNGRLTMTIYAPGHENERADAHPAPMRFDLSLHGNVLGLEFKPFPQGYFGTADMVVSISDNGTFFMRGWPDYRHSNETYPSPMIKFPDSANWHLCWRWSPGNMRHALAWVTTLPPMNPSCEPVQLIREYFEGCEENPLKCPPPPA